MDRTSLVSVIIPCYNVEKYISKSLESVLLQTYTHLEIICINDGSTDETLCFLKKIAAKDSRVLITDQNNGGLSAARNRGISEASGDFIMFLDADDWLERDAVQLALEIEDADLLCFSYNRIFQNKSVPRTLNLNGKFTGTFIQRRIVGLLEEELRDPSQADSIVTAWGKLYRTEIITKNNVRFTDTKMIGTEDALFNIQYLEFAQKVKVIDIPLYNYRKINYDSLTKTYKPELFYQWKVMYSMVQEIIKCKTSDFGRALENRISLSIIGLGLNVVIAPHSNLLKRKNLKIILNDSLYIKAFKNLEMKFLPLHWKLFFLLAKYRNARGLLLFLQIINKLINRKF